MIAERQFIKCGLPSSENPWSDVMCRKIMVNDCSIRPKSPTHAPSGTALVWKDDYSEARICHCELAWLRKIVPSEENWLSLNQQSQNWALKDFEDLYSVGNSDIYYLASNYLLAVIMIIGKTYFQRLNTFLCFWNCALSYWFTSYT